MELTEARWDLLGRLLLALGRTGRRLLREPTRFASLALLGVWSGLDRGQPLLTDD